VFQVVLEKIVGLNCASLLNQNVLSALGRLLGRRWCRHLWAIDGVAAKVEHDLLTHAPGRWDVPSQPGAANAPVLPQARALHGHGCGG
jgi:hypothetical protein